MKVKVEKLDLEGLLLFTPVMYKDDRGYFMETYRREVCEQYCGVEFIQDNESLSRKNVIRAFHFQQPPYAQAKLVRVVAGKIIDVVVDLRKSSPTYGHHLKVLLSSENNKQLFIPKGFAHGFLSLEDGTLVQYKCSEYYHPGSEGILSWNDPDIGVDWGVVNPILSAKDTSAGAFKDFESHF
jgi:dTDP-4-dehydrorhamnose 3,5-epimerase